MRGAGGKLCRQHRQHRQHRQYRQQHTRKNSKAGMPPTLARSLLDAHARYGTGVRFKNVKTRLRFFILRRCRQHHAFG